MHVSITKNEGLERHYKINVSASEMLDKVSSQIQELAKTYKRAGFRPGKVPLKFIEQTHGKAIRAEAVETQINNCISKIVKDNNLDLATSPQIGDLIQDEGKDLEFTLKCEILPEITIPDLKKIKLEKPVPVISESDIDASLEKFVERFKEFKKVSSKTKAKKDDQLLISFEGFIDGNAFDGGKAENHELELGSGSFIQGFEEQLIGSKEGDEKTVKVTFPEDYNFQALAGKKAEFIVIVKEVRQATLPEVNAEFLKRFKIENVEKLRERLAEDAKREYEESIHTIMKVKLFDQLEDKLSFPIPTSLVDREFQILWDQLQEIKDVDETVKSKDEKDLQKYYKKIAARRVRIGLMLAEYSKIKSITINNEDINKALYQQARMFPSNPKAVFEFYQKNPKALESLKGPILEDKAVNMILDQEIEMKVKEYKLSALDKLIDTENNKEVA